MDKANMIVASLFVFSANVASAQVAVQVKPAQPAQPARSAAPSSGTVVVPQTPDYVIGSDDALSVVFWREKDLSADVIVRPDGKISLPLLNDVQAAGLTPMQLGDRLVQEARRFVEDPNVTVVVRQINSRKVFVAGQVAKPGPYMLTGPTTILQMLATAGGLLEYAAGEEISVMRTENGHTTLFSFNYKDMTKHRNLKQNIELKPGDTIVVP